MESLLDRGCSFEASTLVATSNGFVPISEIKEGDYVLAYNEVTKEEGYYMVVYAWAHLDPAVAYVVMDGELVEATPWHQFYTENGWYNADDLTRGMRVRRADGQYGYVDGVYVEPVPQIMYDLTVETAHTFFVGEQQWLVHNCSKYNPYSDYNGPTGNLRRLSDREVRQYDLHRLKDDLGLGPTHSYHVDKTTGDIYAVSPNATNSYQLITNIGSLRTGG